MTGMSVFPGLSPVWNTELVLVKESRPDLYPDAVFETDWSQRVMEKDVIHEATLHRGCLEHKDSVIPWTFGRNESEEIHELVDKTDPKLLEKLRHCPDVDVMVPTGIRSFGYCEDAAAYTKFLESRMLPRWVFEVEFQDTTLNRTVSYHDLCPNTPLLFFNHFWEGLVDEIGWPKRKPVYLMPNIEMYELDSQHYWRADVILCKTAVCSRYLRKWFKQEGNPRGTRVIYTRHTTSNLALTLRSRLSSREDSMQEKNFSDVTFIHAVGSSVQKGTRQVLDCWLNQPDFHSLDLYVDQNLYDGAFKSDYGERIGNSSNIRVHSGHLPSDQFGRVSEGCFGEYNTGRTSNSSR